MKKTIAVVLIVFFLSGCSPLVNPDSVTDIIYQGAVEIAIEEAFIENPGWIEPAKEAIEAVGLTLSSSDAVSLIVVQTALNQAIPEDMTSAKKRIAQKLVKIAVLAIKERANDAGESEDDVRVSAVDVLTWLYGAIPEAQ